MSQAQDPSARKVGTFPAWWPFLLAVPLLAGLAGYALLRDNPLSAESADEVGERRIKAPELAGGVAWLNTAGPIRLKDLRGKVVLLDFWTFCCINCIHTLPDLARLEKKYPNELVVIGIHSAKFDNEKVTANIRKAILRYEITHPVVNDANQRIWRTYGAAGWPSLVLIDPEGYVVYYDSGEGQYEEVDRRIAALVKLHKAKKTLNTRPLKFELARHSETGDSPLFFPGKVLADPAGKRLFIADSTHHRIVITDLEGRKIAVAGTGAAGSKDGPFGDSSFNDPQGMALKDETLYVADRKNHLIRALDLKARKVRTVAGTGEQGRERDAEGPARKVGLNSPWDLLLHDDRLYVAMAGLHQIWVLDLKRRVVAPYAGNGFEQLKDGELTNFGDSRASSSFAQPSGLASDGKALYVADSETSSVRAVPLTGRGLVRTVVGKDLFIFGDSDGSGDEVRLQHALGLAWAGGKLYVADTYNSKVKVIDPARRTCKTLVGGEPEGWLAGPVLSEPGGLSYAGGKLYVADTNAHRIRVIDLKTKAISTLKLRGVKAPRPPKS